MPINRCQRSKLLHKRSGHSRAVVGWSRPPRLKCAVHETKFHFVPISWTLSFFIIIISWHLESRGEHNGKDEPRTQLTIGRSAQEAGSERRLQLVIKFYIAASREKVNLEPRLSVFSLQCSVAYNGWFKSQLPERYVKPYPMSENISD